MPSKGFFFGSNVQFGGCQSTVTMVFTRWPRQDSWNPPFSSTCWHLNRFCNIFLQDLTLLQVKITRSVSNLLSVCRRKLKSLTYIHTVSYNHISFLSTHSQLLWVLASSEFYLITWRMVSICRSAGLIQNSFSKTASI